MSQSKKLRQERRSAIPAVIGDIFLFGVWDVPSGVAAICSLVSEYTMLRYGDTPKGLAAGWALVAASDTLLCNSNVVANNDALKTSLIIGAATFTFGATRYPIGWAGFKLHQCARSQSNQNIKKLMYGCAHNLLKAAVKIKPTAGLLGAFSQFPLIIFSVCGDLQHVKYAMLAAGLCWVTSDVMAGRTQRLFKWPIRYICSFAGNPKPTLNR